MLRKFDFIGKFNENFRVLKITNEILGSDYMGKPLDENIGMFFELERDALSPELAKFMLNTVLNQVQSN